MHSTIIKSMCGKLAALAAAICVAAALPSVAHSASLKFPYVSPIFRMGTSFNDSASTLTDTSKLAFPEMTLDDVAALVDDGYVFGATQCGTYWLDKSVFQARDVLVCRNPATDAISMISVLFVNVHGVTKSLAVELTDGAGGVYARAGRAQFLENISDPSFAFVVPDGNGGVIYSCDTSNAGKASSGTIATYDGGGYGFCSLTLMKLPKTSARSLVFANAPGEPVLTVEDIRDYDFSSLFCGYFVSIDCIGSVAKGYNATVLETDNGRATRMSVDFQIVDGYTKCVVVEFTNGDDGVYAQAVKTLYAGASTHPLGTPSASSGWTANATQPAEYYGVAAATTSAYGVFALSVTPSNAPKAYWNAAENKIASTHRVIDVTTQLPLLTGTWVKMLDGTSLQEMVDDGYEISAYMCGGYVSAKQRVYAKGFQSFTPAGETSISNALCWFAICEGGYTKSAAIEMETRADGVYAKYGKEQFLNKENLDFKFAWLDENGNPVYDCDQASKTAATFYQSVPPTTWTGDGYGVAGLKASRYMKKDESRLVFKNPVGEPVLTLDDIKGHYLGCSFAAQAISNDDCEGVGLHRAFEYDGDSVWSMRVEYQVYDGGWNKCVIVTFTNGVDGVYGYAAAAGHYGKGSGVLGHNFVNASGAFVDCPDGVATAYDGADGYGIYDLFAAPMVTLDRDTDWSEIGGVVPLGDAVVDLNGHNLTLQGVSGNKYTYSKIFNSANDTVAEVRFDVPAGTSFANETVYIGTSAAFRNDNIKVVKKGGGTHVASLKQAYKGGTEIAGGTLKAGIAGSRQPFGAASGVVRVSAGGVLDWNGNYDFHGYPAFALDGGVIRNTGVDLDHKKVSMKGAVLSADSRFDATANWGLVNSNWAEVALNLGGHTLDVATYAGKIMYFTNVRATGGRIDAHGEGIFEVRNDYDGAGIGFVGPGVDLTASCELRLHGPMTVSNYTAAAVADGASVGTNVLNVCGTFKPVTKFFRGCTMQNGATMDFSEWPDSQPVVSTYTCEGDKDITFADGATVYVKLGSRKFAGGKVISWNEKPKNVGTVKFRSAPGEYKRTFTSKDDGLYMKCGGFMVLVR